MPLKSRLSRIPLRCVAPEKLKSLRKANHITGRNAGTASLPGPLNFHSPSMPTRLKRDLQKGFCIFLFPVQKLISPEKLRSSLNRLNQGGEQKMTEAAREGQKKEAETPETGEHTRACRIYAPRVDILERKDDIVVTADMPGVDEKSTDITLEKTVL